MRHITSVAWSDRLELGIPSFDAEHKVFISSVQRWIARIEHGDDKIYVDPMLDKIIDTFRFHSADEENLLAAHDYPDLHDHERAHRHMSSQIDSLRMEFMSSQSRSDLANIGRMLGALVIDHITSFDRDYADYMRVKGLA